MTNFKITWQVLLLLLILIAASSFAINYGTWKPSAEINWLDFVGEGSSLLIMAFVLGLLLKTRAAGRITNGIYLGGSLLLTSMTLDVWDEFLRYPESSQLMSWLESLPMPIGFVVLGLTAHQWYHETQIMQRQMRLRETHLREHRWLDPLTLLYTKPYLEYVLKREISLQRATGQSLTLVGINIKNFDLLNQQLGCAVGDQLLRQLGELLVLLSRPDDTACREHADRFVLVLPHTTMEQAEIIVRTLLNALTEALNKVTEVRLEASLLRVTEPNAVAALRQLNALMQQSSVATSKQSNDAQLAHH